MRTICEILERFELQAPGECVGQPASQHDIERVEVLLGVQLPNSSKAFLLRFGSSHWPDAA